MNRTGTGLRETVAAAVAVLVVYSAVGEELPTGATKLDGGEMPTGEELGKLGGNWGYKMNDWEWKTPVENQKRWDRETKGWWFNFGPTGIRVMFEVDKPRVAKVMYVYPDSPAAKKIFAGDEIIGVNGKKFTSDEPFPSGSKRDGFRISGPRLEAAKAIEESEGNPRLNGILTLSVRRKMKTIPVEIQLEKLGYFSPTFPYNCQKSRKLAEAAGDWFIENAREHTWRGKTSTILKWGPPRMGDWVDFPGQLALMSFGDRYKDYFEPTGSGGAMWSWISGIRLINAAEKQQLLNDKALITKLEEMSHSYAGKSGPSGAYSHKTWYEGAPFQLAFAGGLNALGQAIAQKCGASIATDSYLRTRYLLTVKTNEKGHIGYGAANKTPYSAEDARKAVGNINTRIIGDDEWIGWRLVGGAACTTLTHFVDPRDSYSEAFVKRGVRHAMAAGMSARQSHGCGSLTFVYNCLAASIAPLVGEDEKYRKYMDDMKWWLIMARCHNGGWYFEPKIDTEANPYERIHMTAAAILMLNAPLRELYCNGKGHKDPNAATAAPTRTPAAPVKPKLREARSLSAKSRDILDRSLLKALVKLSDENKLKPIVFGISKTRAPVFLAKASDDGKLTFGAQGSSKTAEFKWDDLVATDKANMAILMAQLRPESTDSQALVGVYMEGLGRVEDADKYFEKAGEQSRKKLESLFEKPSKE